MNGSDNRGPHRNQQRPVMAQGEPEVESIRDWELCVREILELNGDDRPEAIARRSELHQQLQEWHAEYRRRNPQFFRAIETERNDDFER